MVGSASRNGIRQIQSSLSCIRVSIRSPIRQVRTIIIGILEEGMINQCSPSTIRTLTFVITPCIWIVIGIIAAIVPNTFQLLKTDLRVLVPGGGVEPPRPEGRRILSSTVGSEPLGKFSTLLYFSTGYQKRRLHRSDPNRRVLNMELLQFYYSVSSRVLSQALPSLLQEFTMSECNRNGQPILNISLRNKTELVYNSSSGRCKCKMP